MSAEADRLLAALDALAEIVARKVVDELRAGEQPGMVDQARSPLGRRRHIAAVRRLVNSGQPGAAIVGRRHLLSQERVAEALAKTTRPTTANDSNEADGLADLREDFRRAAS